MVTTRTPNFKASLEDDFNKTEMNLKVEDNKQQV